MQFRTQHSIEFLDETGSSRNHSEGTAAIAFFTDSGGYASEFNLDSYGFRHRYALSREFGIELEFDVLYTVGNTIRSDAIMVVALPPDEVRELIESALCSQEPLTVTRQGFNNFARQGRQRSSSFTFRLTTRKSEVFVESVEATIPPEDAEYIAERIRLWIARSKQDS